MLQRLTCRLRLNLAIQIQELNEACIISRLNQISATTKIIWPHMDIPNIVWSIILEFADDIAFGDKLYANYVHYKRTLLSSLHIIPWFLGNCEAIIMTFCLFNYPNNTYIFGILLLIITLIHFFGIITSLLSITKHNKEQLLNMKQLLYKQKDLNYEEEKHYNMKLWELYIIFQNWCNVLYPTNFYINSKYKSTTHPIFHLVVLHVMKQIFCVIIAIYLFEINMKIVIGLWIVYCYCLCYLIMVNIFFISWILSVILSIFFSVFWCIEAIRLEFDLVSFLIILVTMCFLLFIFSIFKHCMSSRKCTRNLLIFFGVHCAVVIFYVLTVLSYFNGFKLYVLNIAAFYALYICFQFVLFSCNEARNGGNINVFKFVSLCWIFGWFNVEIFDKYYLLTTNQIVELQTILKQNRKYNQFRSASNHPMSTGLMF